MYKKWEFGGGLMIVWLETETWVISKGGTKKGEGGWGRCGKRYGGSWVLLPLFVVGCISTIVVKGACIRDCKGLGVCMVVIVS
jgi:hypothetical protein